MIWRNFLPWNVCLKRSEPFRRCSSPCRHSRPWKGNLCRETFRQFGKVPSGRGTGRAHRRKQLRGISPEDIVRISLIDRLDVETCSEDLTSCTLLSLLRISFAFSQSVFTWHCSTKYIHVTHIIQQWLSSWVGDKDHSVSICDVIPGFSRVCVQKTPYKSKSDWAIRWILYIQLWVISWMY